MKIYWLALTLWGIGLTSVAVFADPEVPAPAVVTLQFRNYHVTVSSSDKGALYTVKDTDGKVIGEQLSAGELQSQLPAVHRFIRDAFAGDRKAFIDASNATDHREL